MESMKNTIAAVALLCGSALPFGASAQGVEPQTRMVAQTKVTEVVEFNPHWLMQLQAGGGYTIGETKFKDLMSPAAAINFGYRFSPVFGLRVGASGWMAKGSWVYPRNDYKFNYVQGNIDAMVSLTNLFCGYNPDRVLDFYGFLGVGGAYGFHNHEAERLYDDGCHFMKMWDGSKLFFAARGGLGVDINVSDHVAINLEVNANMLPDGFNSKKGSTFDWQYNAFVGVSFKFGKTRKVNAIETQEMVEEVYYPEPAPAPAPAPAPVVEQPKPAPAPAKIEKDIFFTINSARIRQDEESKVADLVAFMKQYPDAKITVTGYADKETGTPSYNMQLSKKRAEAVADALVAGGIDGSRITVRAMGETEQPFSGVEKNRVAIGIATE